MVLFDKYFTPPYNQCLDFKKVSSKQTPLATFYGTDKIIFGCLNFFGWEILGLFTYKVDYFQDMFVDM